MNEIMDFLEQSGVMNFLEQPGMLFVVLGLVAVVSGGRDFWRTLSFWRRAQSTDGTVTELREKWSDGVGDNGRHKVNHPVLRFTTQDGREVQTEADPSPVNQGAQITIYYDPNDPSDVTLTRFGFDIISTVSVFPVGLFFVLQGILMMSRSGGTGFGSIKGTGFGSMFGESTGFGIVSGLFSLFPFIFAYVGLVFALSSISQLRLARRAGGTGSVITYTVQAGIGLLFVIFGLSWFRWFPLSVI